MATFTATYTSATGQERTLTIKANDVATAKRQLRRRGIKATELRASETGSGRNRKKEPPAKADGTSGGSWLSIDLGEAFQKPPGVKEKAVWASKLAALVDAGVPIVRSLDLMSTQQKLPMFKKALTAVGVEVNQGTAMGAAMRQWSDRRLRHPDVSAPMGMIARKAPAPKDSL